MSRWARHFFAGGGLQPWCAAAMLMLAWPCHAADAAAPAELERAANAPAAASSSASGALAASPTQALDAVVIHNTRALQAVDKHSVSAKELSHVPGSMGDPLKSLQSLPGIATAREGSSAPAIRGSRPEDNRFLVDGLPAGNVFHVGGLTSVFNPDLVSRFDLYSAAFGPEYADVIGGVIDVRLRRPRTDRIGGTLDLSLLGADVLVEGPVVDGQSFYFAGKRSWIDLIMKRVSDGKDPASDGTIVQMPRYSDYLGKYFWRLNEANELKFQLSGASDHLDLNIPADSKLAQQQPVLMGEGRMRTSDRIEAITWDSRWSRDTSNRVSLGQHTTTANNQLGTALSLDVKQQDRYVIDQVLLKPHPAHDLTLGAELHSVHSTYSVDVRNARCTEFSPECDYSSAAALSVANQLDVRMMSLYAKDRWQFAPDWAATLGVQHARDAYLARTNTAPRLGLEWKWLPDTLLSMAWGRYDQIPRPEQIAPVLGNPQLDHIHATHAVAGISQKLTDAWSLQVEAYHKTMNDLVIADATRNYINGGSGTADGLELLLKKNTLDTDKLSGWLAISWARSKRHNDETGESFAFAYDQPLILNVVGNYKLGGGWLGGLKWSYHTGMPYTAVTGTGTYPDGRVRPLYGPLNGDRLPAFHRLDLRMEKQITRDVHVYGELLNAYARKNVVGYGYSADYATRYTIRGLGMLPSLGMSMNF